MTYSFLQQYWWCIISLLAGLLVFLMFVQGGNFLAMVLGRGEMQRKMIIASTGRKWELTFTTLVLFGGAFFASFPLFYSTSFGGAYWVWILLLVSFVFQAVSYEFQVRRGNLLGVNTFRFFLAVNGFVGPFVVGTAVGTFFTGSDFLVNKEAITDGSLMPTISVWGNAWHGLEALANPWNVTLGLAVFFLALTLGALYLINNIDDDETVARLRKTLPVSVVLFLVAFLTWLVHLLVADGFAVAADGTVSMEQYKYLHNFLQMPLVFALFLLGVLLVLLGFVLGIFTRSKRGIWATGIGSVLAVFCLFLVAGLNGTAYYPSSHDLQSSLTIANSSSSPFTLQVMFYVSLVIPLVLAYIVYAWRALDAHPITRQDAY